MFQRFCKSAISASRQRENFMESLHSNGSATYLLIIWVEKKYTFSNEIETKTISLNCFSKYSTIKLTHVILLDWAKILDKKGQVDTFILDFEKAFDTPPHELLKSKFFSCGIGGTTLNWINTFLDFRQQRVVVNGIKSDWAPVVSGVPQGTVLGPLLFSFYINDFSADIESEKRLFADDCICYREIKNEEDTLKLQRGIDRLDSWARKWELDFNPSNAT